MPGVWGSNLEKLKDNGVFGNSPFKKGKKTHPIALKVIEDLTDAEVNFLIRVIKQCSKEPLNPDDNGVIF